MISLREGISVEALGANTYSAYFHPDWCIGIVPHGGYVTSTFLSVAKLHFSTVRADYDQPHTIAVQLTFLRRTSSGCVQFTVTEPKLGRRTSTIHISLSQNDDAGPLVVGYFTQSNMYTETGISLSLPRKLHPEPPSLTSTKSLLNGTATEWTLHKPLFSKFRRAGQHLITYLPRKRHQGMVVDQWLTMASGENFTQESLGYIVDSFPQLLETVQKAGAMPNSGESLGEGRDQSTKQDEKENPERTLARSQTVTFWYPTVLLNMEVKKMLPAEGTDWLFSRVQAKKIRNGRMDLELLILDQGGDVIALSNHVALIVPAERNMGRGSKGTNHANSKI